MPAAQYDLFIEQGATFKQEFIVRDEVLDGAGQHQVPPVYAVRDLTGYQARAKFKGTVGGATFASFTSTPAAGLVVGGATGKITLTITDEQTTAFTWTSGVYDLEIENAAGEVTRILKGTVTVDPEVTSP